MWVIGITGGIASGKSKVAHELQRRGARVVDADGIGHSVLERADIQATLHARWGDEVFAEGKEGAGHLDRAAIAQRVFAPPPEGPRELSYLEAVIHPEIGARVVALLDRWRAEGTVPAAVLDAPVLHKAGWTDYCDRILHVDAPLEVRAGRAARRGWSVDQLLARERMQPSMAWQRQAADWVIDNGGSWALTVAQIDEFWKTLFAEGKKRH
ncbi:MAG: dephospho-CoA kinase [Planctomycetota bacterium]